MTRDQFRHPVALAGRFGQSNGLPRYALIVNSREIALTAHVGYDAPDCIWISSRNERGDYRPIRLTVAEATALRDGLSMFIADQDSNPNPEKA